MGEEAPLDTPVVSIVVPCFNHADSLGEALASVGASLVRTEIIVIDYGSTDATPEVLASLESRGDVRSIRQSNAGAAAARNRGLRESRGKYVIFLDADDRLVPGAVDTGAARLEEHQECAFVFGRCLMMDGDGVLLDTPSQPRIERDHYRELLRNNYILMPATVMFRRATLERIGGFNGHVNAAADYEMYLHIARHYPVHDHGQVVAHCRRREATASADPARMLRETLAVLSFQRPFLEADEASLAAYNEGRRRWQEFYGEHLVTEMRHAVQQHRWFDAAVKAAVLGRYHPRGLWGHARRRAEVAFHPKGSASSQVGRTVPAEISVRSARASAWSGWSGSR